MYLCLQKTLKRHNKDGVKKFDGTGPFKLGEHKKMSLQTLTKMINTGAKSLNLTKYKQK